MQGHVARKRDRYYAVIYDGLDPSQERRSARGILRAPTAAKRERWRPGSRRSATVATTRSVCSASAPTSPGNGCRRSASSCAPAPTGAR